jgi:plastocyanin
LEDLMRRLPIPALAVAALIALAGCASGSTAAVSIKDFAFNPQTTQAKVGESITWTNQDSTAHTVTLDDKSVDSGNVAPSATFSHAFTQAGTFTYHCEIHKQMTGTITVSG